MFRARIIGKTFQKKKLGLELALEKWMEFGKFLEDIQG